MREIKFRAWHKNINYMCQNVKTDLLDRDYLEFMQYTGLKENGENGKDIYEGDIVTIYPFDHEVYEVIWDKDRWCLKDRTYNSERKEPFFNVWGKQKSLKIVGNIYEGCVCQKLSTLSTT